MTTMTVEALGGPHDGLAIALPSSARTLEFLIEPERQWSITDLDKPTPLYVPVQPVTYDIVRWYTGTTDEGETGRIVWVVFAPDYWPKGLDPKVYPPPEWGHR